MQLPACRRHQLALIFCFALAISGFSQDSQSKPLVPDTVKFKSGNLKLTGLLWLPAGKGPFPAVLYNHGSEAKPERFLDNPSRTFVEHGYAFFVPFRRGQGLSKGQGKYVIDEADSVSKAGGGFPARFTLIRDRLETTQLQDQLAGLAFLKSQPLIDAKRIAVIGISFGGIQTMLAAARAPGIKAAMNFAGAAMMWDKSPEVGIWMKEIAKDAKVPVYFVQAENDFSLKPSLELSEEMKKAGKPFEIKIYPPRGTTPMEGHTFIDDSNTWGPDVFPWLDGILKVR